MARRVSSVELSPVVFAYAVSIACAALGGCASNEPHPAAPTTASGSDVPPPIKSITEVEAELAERIRAVVVAERPRLRGCYEEALARSPGLTGRVVLVLEVDQKGSASRVFEAKREGLGEREVQCFARVLKTTKFHDGAGSAVTIKVPLAFSPTE